MTRTANYTRPIHLALQVIKEAGVEQFPINLKTILRHYRIQLFTYTEYCASNECTLEECMAHCGRDGATIAMDGGFVIVYNEKATPQNRIRFTIAHELGHIFLGHHEELGQRILQRLWVEKSLYDVMEDEANCFARNLLCPALAVQIVLRAHGYTFCEYDSHQNRNVWQRVKDAEQLPDLPHNLTDYYLIHQSFMVTDSAAKTRCHFVREDLRNTQMSIATEVIDGISFSAQWRCRKCGALRLSGSTYCYYCGGRNQFSLISKPTPCQKPRLLKYRGLQFSSCPVCGNDSIPPGANYCTICGNAAANLCIPWRVRNRSVSHLMALAENGVVHANPPGCRYCLTCGSPTLHGEAMNRIPLYYYLRFLKHDPDSQGGLPTVKYGPRIQFDPNTYQVKKCPVCLFDDHESDADYCIICGTSLRNICDGGRNDYDEYERHNNPPNARFCRCCGSPTAYSKLKILPSYTSFLMKKREDEKLHKELVESEIDEKLFWAMQENDSDAVAKADTETGAAASAATDATETDEDELPF